MVVARQTRTGQRQPSIHAAAFSRQASRTASAGWRQRRKKRTLSQPLTRTNLRTYERVPASCFWEEGATAFWPPRRNIVRHSPVSQTVRIMLALKIEE